MTGGMTAISGWLFIAIGGAQVVSALIRSESVPPMWGVLLIIVGQLLLISSRLARIEARFEAHLYAVRQGLMQSLYGVPPRDPEDGNR